MLLEFLNYSNPLRNFCFSFTTYLESPEISKQVNLIMEISALIHSLSFYNFKNDE